MDPITLIGLLASLSNLVEASNSIMRMIKTYREGDKELNELLRNVSVFAEALRGFDRVLRSRQTMHQISGSVIQHALDAATETMKDLEARLLHSTRLEASVARRMKWVQHKSGIKKLQERLKDHNAMLQTFVSLAHAETFLAAVNQHPQFMMLLSSAETDVAVDSNEQLVEDVTSLHGPRLEPDSSSSATRPRRHSIASSITSARSSTFSLDSRSDTSSSSSIGSSSASLRQSFDSKPPSMIRSNMSSEQHKLPKTSRDSLVTRDDSVIDRAPNSRLATDTSSQRSLVIRRACRYNCFCKCHELEMAGNSTSFPKFKSAKRRCTEATCRNAIVAKEEYQARSRSFRKALSEVLSSKNITVRYNLNTYRMVPEGSDAMRHVKHGNLEKLKACIASGEATLWDTAPDGWSLLHTAAYSRHLPIVKYLLDAGADTEAGDVGSRRPADLALFKSLGQDATDIEEDIVEVFSQKDDCIRDFEFTPIHIAVLQLYDTTDTERPSLESLIQVLDDANNAPVGTDWAKWKLRYKNRSPLFSAIIEYFRASAFEQSSPNKIIHNLLDQRDKKNCWPPLHWAASAGKVDKMRILVDNGADPFLLSNLNANVLHAAAESRIGHGLEGALEIWKRFPNRLNINQTNKWGETPLHVASWCSAPCVKLLLEAGANPDVTQEDGQVALHCSGLSGRGPDRREIVSLLCGTESRNHINTQDVDGRPPIFDFLDDSECLEMLIDHGARSDLVDKSGKSFFHHACIQDESDALRTALRLVDDFLTATKKDDDGNTPLIESLCHKNIDCALVLLELEDVGDIVGKDGWAAVHYAVEIGDVDLLQAVLKHPSFVRGMKTVNGKTVDAVAMEAGTWCGEVKELVRKYNSLG